MGGNVDTIKERLDIVEVVSPYLKLEKTGINLKGKCPFHNEKTPSFFVSPVRQSYYCFGCGAKGDMFTFVEQMEGIDFVGALKILAEKAGVELRPPSAAGAKEKALKEKLFLLTESATDFFEAKLKESPEVSEYLFSRGLEPESIKTWRIGYVPDEWRLLLNHLKSLGFDEELIIKAGLAKKPAGKEGKGPYDVFRGRIIFPIADTSGRIVGFSGRSFLPAGTVKDPDSIPKYLNSPDSLLFNKGELLYGLDKAKHDIRRQAYTVLVEGQLDLVLSYQAGVKNTVASSGTAFTATHLRRLKSISPRIILAFDGDEAGKIAAEKSATLGLGLGMEVKIARLPQGSDPADLVKQDTEKWKEVLRQSVPAIESVLNRVLEEEKDKRKQGKLIEQKVLPLVALIESAMERSHFVLLIAKRAGLKEDAVWQDLGRTKPPAIYALSGEIDTEDVTQREDNKDKEARKPRHELIRERLDELKKWRQELKKGDREIELLAKEEAELEANLAEELLKGELAQLTAELSQAEGLKDQSEISRLSEKATRIHKDLRALEERRRVM